MKKYKFVYHWRDWVVDEWAVLGASIVECKTQPHSLHYFCPTCGRMWAVIDVKGVEEQIEPYHEVIPLPCELHVPKGLPEWTTIPGTLCSLGTLSKGLTPNHDKGRCLDTLPAEVIKREFLTTLKHYEEKLNDSWDK